MVIFPTWIPDCDSHTPALLDLLFSSDSTISSSVVLPPLGNCDYVVVSVSIEFSLNSKEDAPFHSSTYEICYASWNSLYYYLRNVSWENIFKIGATATSATEFCEIVQTRIDVYIPFYKY